VLMLGIERSKGAIREDFERHTRTVNRDIELNISRIYSALLSGSGLYAASSFVDADEWDKFVGQVLKNNHFETSPGFAFIERVPYDRLDDFEHEMREMSPGYLIHRIPGAKPDPAYRAPVKYFYPRDEYDEIVGLDFTSFREARAAMRSAAEENRVSMTSRVCLHRTGMDDWVVVTYYPIYKGTDQIPDNPAARLDAILGWIAVPVPTEAYVLPFGTELDEIDDIEIVHVGTARGNTETCDRQQRSILQVCRGLHYCESSR